MYVAAESFRFKVTGEADARDNARQRHEGDRPPGGDHRPARLSRALVHQGRSRRAAVRRRMARHAGQGSGGGKGTRARTRSSATTSSIRSTTTWWPTKSEKPALRAVIDRITNHILDNDYQLIDVDGKRTRWGWWGPDVIWEDPDETGLRALHMLSHLRVALHLTGDAGVPRAVPGGVRRPDQDAPVPPAHAQPEDHGAGLDQSLGRRAGVPVVLSAAALRDATPRCSRSTNRASSAAGRSSGRSAIRCGT